MTDTAWTDTSLDELRSEFGDAYRGRTVLVTGADGFMGSHLTDALVELGANVHAFVRATSSGALNNIGHLRHRLEVHFADLTDRTSIDYLVRELKDTAPDRPYVFHLGAQAHVGESWHRPYETVMANTVGTLNLLRTMSSVSINRSVEGASKDEEGLARAFGLSRLQARNWHLLVARAAFVDIVRGPVYRSLSTPKRLVLGTCVFSLVLVRFSWKVWLGRALDRAREALESYRRRAR